MVCIASRTGLMARSTRGERAAHTAQWDPDGECDQDRDRHQRERLHRGVPEADQPWIEGGGHGDEGRSPVTGPEDDEKYGKGEGQTRGAI